MIGRFHNAFELPPENDTGSPCPRLPPNSRGLFECHYCSHNERLASRIAVPNVEHRVPQWPRLPRRAAPYAASAAGFHRPQPG